MIFTGFAPTDFSVQVGFTNKDRNADRLKYIQYEDGGFDVVDFGARGVDLSQIEISAITKEDFPTLTDYLTENVGNEIEIQDTSDVFGQGQNDPTLYNVFVEKIVPKGEEAYSEVGFYEIVLTIRKPTGLSPKREFLVEIDLNAFSVDIQVGDVGSLPPGVEGQTALVLTPRSLYEYSGGMWIETFPLKPYEVTFYVATLSEIVGRPQETNTAYTTADRNFYTYTDGDWVSTTYPNLSAWKPVVNNDPSIGLLNGILRWSAFDNGTYNGEEFTAGFVSEKGIKFPTKSAPVDKGHGIEILDGFKVKINNAERFSLVNVEFNFFGAVCTLSVYKEGSGTIIERIGLNKTNSFDPGFFELEVEPFLWLDQSKNVVQETFGADGSNGKQGAPNLYGGWDYAPLIRKNDQLEYLEDANGFSVFTVHDVSAYDAINGTTKFRTPRPATDFVLPEIVIDNPEWFSVISGGSKLYRPVSVTYQAGVPGIPNGFIEVEIETGAPLSDLVAGVTFRCLLFNVVYVTDLVSTVGIQEPLEVYTYIEDTDTFERVPNGIFEKIDEQTLRLMSNPDFVIVNGGEILFAIYYATAFKRGNYYQEIGVELIDPRYLGVSYDYIDTNESTNTELKIYKYESAGITDVAFVPKRFSAQQNYQKTIVYNSVDSVAPNAVFIWGAQYPLSTIFIRTYEEVLTSISANSIGLAFDKTALNWYGSQAQYDDAGVVTGAESSGLPPTFDTNECTFRYQDSRPGFPWFDILDPYLPQANDKKALGNVFTWDLTDEIKSQLVGANEVRFLTAFSVMGFGMNKALTGSLGRAGSGSGGGGNQDPRRGHYANVTTEMWLRHRDNPSLDRLVRTIEKTTTSEGASDESYLRTGQNDRFAIMGTYPRNYLFAKCSPNEYDPFQGDSDNSIKFHQFANLPSSLGGADKFYSSEDEDFVSNEFWLLWLLVDDGVVAKDMIGETIGNTADPLRVVEGTIVDATILDIRGNSYTDNTAIPAQLGFVTGGPLTPNTGRGWLCTKMFSDDPLSSWVARNPSDFGTSDWEFSKNQSAIVNTNPFHDGYPEYSYSGRDLFKFDQGVVDELFGADDYKFDEYERLEVVNYLWRTRENNDSSEDKDLYKMVQVDFRPHNILSVPGSQNSEYKASPGVGYFEAAQEYDSDETYYVKAEGRVGADGVPINNPRLIAQDQIQNVVPNFQIGFKDSYAEREAWLARSFLQGEKSVRQVLEDLTRSTHSVLTYNDEGNMDLSSAYIGDYNGFTKKDFDASTIGTQSKNQVKYRDITKIFTDFSFKFHFNTGKGEVDRELRIKLSSDGQSLDVQGLEPNAGDAQELRERKAQMLAQLEGRVLEDFQVSNTFYNTGKVNAFEDEYAQYYDTNTEATTIQGTLAYGIRSIYELAWRWIRSFIVNSWEVEFKTNMDVVLDDPSVSDDNRLRVADPISYALPSITGDLVLYGLIKKIKPDYYNGQVSITIFSAVDPFVFATLYDRIGTATTRPMTRCRSLWWPRRP